MGKKVKPPKLPENSTYWLNIATNPKLVKDFFSKGTKEQKNSLVKAIEYIKYHKEIT